MSNGLAAPASNQWNACAAVTKSTEPLSMGICSAEPSALR
jgi:hypothetical protein